MTMEIDRLKPTYIASFVKECRDSGLTEEQTTTMLDDLTKMHLAQNNEHYQAGAHAVFAKAAGRADIASEIGKRLAGIGGIATTAGAGINAFGSDELKDKLSPTVTGTAGAGLGALSLLRGKRMPAFKGIPLKMKSLPGKRKGLSLEADMSNWRAKADPPLPGTSPRESLADALPFSRAKFTKKRGPGRPRNDAPAPKDYKGFDYAPEKWKNHGAQYRALRPIAVGGIGGALAPSADSAISGAVDWNEDRKINKAQDRLAEAGLPTGAGGDSVDAMVPWYARLKDTGSGRGGREIPNLALLPPEAQRTIRGGGGRRGGMEGPYAAIGAASQSLGNIDKQLAAARESSMTPGLSPIERNDAAARVRSIEALRNKELSKMRSSSMRIQQDQQALERAKIEARAQNAVNQRRTGKQMDRNEAGGGNRGGLFDLFKGRQDDQGSIDERRMQLEQQLLQQQQRRWELDNKIPNLMNPRTQMLLEQQGIK